MLKVARDVMVVDHNTMVSGRFHTQTRLLPEGALHAMPQRPLRYLRTQQVTLSAIAPVATPPAAPAVSTVQ
jgi:hypothetical protein